MLLDGVSFNEYWRPPVKAIGRGVRVIKTTYKRALGYFLLALGAVHERVDVFLRKMNRSICRCPYQLFH